MFGSKMDLEALSLKNSKPNIILIMRKPD